MSESTFTASINQSIRKRGVYAWKIAAGYAVGVPDAWYSGTQSDVWVEYKATTYTRKRFGLSVPQRLWLEQRHAEGRQCWLVVDTPGGIAVFDAPPYPAAKIPEGTALLTRSEFIDRLVNHVSTQK